MWSQKKKKVSNEFSLFIILSPKYNSVLSEKVKNIEILECRKSKIGLDLESIIIWRNGEKIVESIERLKNKH